MNQKGKKQNTNSKPFGNDDTTMFRVGGVFFLRNNI